MATRKLTPGWETGNLTTHREHASVVPRQRIWRGIPGRPPAHAHDTAHDEDDAASGDCVRREIAERVTPPRSATPASGTPAPAPQHAAGSDGMIGPV
ncbi:MAG: hypothetical protein OXK82_12115 [Deltaproteobacteria bacterium]|nr:hypothetical protein [Deltaproteobacteria bacterium]